MPNTIEFQFLISKRIFDCFPIPASSFRPQGPKHHIQVATLNINKEHKTVESSKLYYLIN
jgi:hypothetical protein